MFIYFVPFYSKVILALTRIIYHSKGDSSYKNHIRLRYRKLQTIHAETAITEVCETCPDEKKNHLTEMTKRRFPAIVSDRPECPVIYVPQKYDFGSAK